MTNKEIHSILKKTKCIRDFIRFIKRNPFDVYEELQKKSDKKTLEKQFMEYIVFAAQTRGIKPPKYPRKSMAAKKSGRFRDVNQK